MEETVISVDMRLAKSGLSVRAYEKLKVLILDHAIPPGARLGIDVLAAQLGISQTPVREALARLEGDGLVLRSVTGRYHAAPQLDLEAFDQLYTMRLLLEPERRLSFMGDLEQTFRADVETKGPRAAVRRYYFDVAMALLWQLAKLGGWLLHLAK